MDGIISGAYLYCLGEVLSPSQCVCYGGHLTLSQKELELTWEQPIEKGDVSYPVLQVKD